MPTKETLREKLAAIDKAIMHREKATIRNLGRHAGCG